MKKKFLSIVGFAIVCRMQVNAQTNTSDTSLFRTKAVSQYIPVDTGKVAVSNSTYNPRKLRVDEIDLVSSYYSQTGDHSAITGGIGTQQVTDLSNGITLNLVWQNQAGNKNTLLAGLGYDHHTSASAAYVNLTGSSRTGGTRIYPSLDWTIENAKTGNTFGVGAYYSGEYNYHSKEINVHWSAKTDDKDGEFGIQLSSYFDRVTLIYPTDSTKTSTITGGAGTVITTASGNTEFVNAQGQIETRHNNLPGSERNTYTAAMSYTQQVNSRLQVMVLGDFVQQTGYLGLPYHRVYFNTGKDTTEKLPSSRFKLPLGVRVNYFIGDDIILRAYYRYYTDNWGVRSSTANLEIPVKVTPFFSISPFYRFYTQTAARYFAPFGEHSPTDEYYTSNYEYSAFNSSFFGIGFRVAPPNGVFGWQNLHDLELRYGHYAQTTDLVSDVVSLNLGFK